MWPGFSLGARRRLVTGYVVELIYKFRIRVPATDLKYRRALTLPIIVEVVAGRWERHPATLQTSASKIHKARQLRIPPKYDSGAYNWAKIHLTKDAPHAF